MSWHRKGFDRKPLRNLVWGGASIVALLVSFEGIRQYSYLDSVGVPTIGVGHTGQVKLGDVITRQEAMELLGEDIKAHQAELAKCIKVPLAVHEWTAYTSLAFNVGASAICKSTLVRKLNSGDYSGGCAEILRWNRAGGRVLQGLVKRREAEYRLCMGETK